MRALAGRTAVVTGTEQGANELGGPHLLINSAGIALAEGGVTACSPERQVRAPRNGVSIVTTSITGSPRKLAHLSYRYRRLAYECVRPR